MCNGTIVLKQKQNIKKSNFDDDDGPPILEPPRQCNVMARPQFNLEDVMAVTWAADYTMPSAFCNLSWNALVFHTAAQWTAAAITVQRVAWKRLEMLAAAATVIETAARRCLAAKDNFG